LLKLNAPYNISGAFLGGNGAFAGGNGAFVGGNGAFSRHKPLNCGHETTSTAYYSFYNKELLIGNEENKHSQFSKKL